MEALVNVAYDRISEDIILLYDAMRAYNEVGPFLVYVCTATYMHCFCVRAVHTHL